MPYCSKVCINYLHKKKLKDKWYSDGVKRCNFCKIFMKIDGNKCPCCKSKLRLNGRNTEVKALREMKRID